MDETPQILWLNVSPSLKGFDRPLLRYLANSTSIAYWEYCQTVDEPSSLDTAIALLHDYCLPVSQPLHLVGHGMAGTVGLLYARRYPERVKSLSLLAVAASPAIDWQAHYYTRRQLLPCSREFVLSQMVRELFGQQPAAVRRQLQIVLERDLAQSPSPHSLWKVDNVVAPAPCPVPLLVCGSRDDTVVDPTALRKWLSWFKAGDRLWECPGGRHFFHRFYPHLVESELLDFWDTVDGSEIRTEKANSPTTVRLQSSREFRCW
jgi:pimeloyl-ACP methyl ester carboxylesterase